MAGTPRHPRLGAGPLHRRIQARGGFEALAEGTVDPERKRIRAGCHKVESHALDDETLDIYFIDRFCIDVLGVNPTHVYGWDFLDVEPGEVRRVA